MEPKEIECEACNGTGQHEMDEKEFEEYLNDCFGDVNICGLNYGAGYALKEIDPIAFRCAMVDHEEECQECEGSGKVIE